jgi:hypothetical protein
VTVARTTARERDEYARRWRLPPYRPVIPADDLGTPLYAATVASQGFDPATDCEDWSLRRYAHLLHNPDAIHTLTCPRWEWEPCDCAALDVAPAGRHLGGPL